MKYRVLLLKDLPNYGKKGELVQVVPGFARNFLLPKKWAILATQATVRLKEKLRLERIEETAIEKKEAEKLSDQLKAQMFEIVVKADVQGHLYGSVTALDVAQKLASLGYKIEKRQVRLAQSIKKVGVYPISLKLAEGIEVSISFTIKSDHSQEPKEEKK